jgi:hypothetical protein
LRRMNLRFAAFLLAMLMVLGAPLPTVAQEELSPETGVAALGRLAAAACAGVGVELADTPLVASELLRLVRAELD